MGMGEAFLLRRGRGGMTTWRRAAGFAAAFALVVGVLAAGLAGTVSAAGEDSAPIVREIAVAGNQRIPAETIMAAVTKTKVGEPLDQSKVYADLYAIYNLGWFREDISADPQALADRSGVKVVFNVTEYPVIKEIKIEGLTALSPSKVLPYLRAKTGEVFNRRELQEDVHGLAQKVYDHEGIALRPVDVNFDLETGVLVVQVKETRVGKVTITGNQKTREYVIRRELLLGPGDVFDRNKLYDSLWRIKMLGHFEDVQALFPDQQEDPDVVDLTIEVKERKTGQASFSAGYSSASGFMGGVEVSDTNFLGRGETVRLRLSAGQKQTEYDAEFYEPYLDRHRTSLDVRAYNTRTLVNGDGENTYDQQRQGGSLTLGRPLSLHTGFTAGLKIENVTNGGRLPEGVEPKSVTHSLQLGLNTNTTDDPYDPTSGYRNSLSLEFAGGPLLGGTANFSKYENEFSAYRKIGAGGQVLAFRLMAGASGGELPAHERYVVGGADTVRGYQFGADKGVSMLVLNSEYRFPIGERVKGVIFLDGGRAWKENEVVRLTELKGGFGAGLRVDTPIGTIRLDYGFPMGDDRRGKFYFSFGQTF